MTELREGEKWADLVKNYESIGNQLEVNFGEALVFNAGLFHGSKNNLTDETRWTINVRFKNVFSPTEKILFNFLRFFTYRILQNLVLN